MTDLLQVPGKAEIVNDQIVEFPPFGFLPGYATAEVRASLYGFGYRTRTGYSLGGNVAFLVDLSNRKSFSPDAAFHTGRPTGMKFLEGAPVFAVEVRSEGDYGAAAEAEMAAKRADYFAAGTLVVWDVDMLSSDVVRAYQADSPDKPTRYRRGDHATAEPAVPGWSLEVETLFPYDID